MLIRGRARSQRRTERELEQLLFLIALAVQGDAELEPERAKGRQPAHPAPDRVAEVADVEPVALEPGVPDVAEDHAAEPELLDDREDDLVLDDQLVRPSDRFVVDDVPLRVEGVLARTERTRLEASDRVDPAREVALDER